MSEEIELGGQVYRTGRIDTIKQFHVARRLAPVVASVGTSMFVPPKDKEMTKEELLFHMFEPAMLVVSKMSDEDVNYIIGACLSVAQRKSGDKWAAVMTGGQIMFQDMDMSTTMRLTMDTLRGNLGDFFPQPPGGLA